ncbi:ATP-binding protein [Streptomyces sp. NPDC004732]|uniref:PAS domain-containing sensor histidine kinase n=1 Tax=Streptomyces sp. NPDC004732 TaxID=3154290 RepID=UPI0033B07E99
MTDSDSRGGADRVDGVEGPGELPERSEPAVRAESAESVESDPDHVPGTAPHGYGHGHGHHRIEAVVAAAPDGIVAVDEDGLIRLCNPAAAELFGRPAGELPGLAFGFPLTAGGTTEIDLVLPSGSGRVVEMRVTATHSSGERLYIATLRDVTERRRTQRALEAALARQDTVIAVTAHELRNPLATIGVLAHTLRDAGAALTDEQRTDIAHRIVESTEMLQSLVRKHLAAARIDAKATHVTPRPVPVLELVLELVGAVPEDAPETEVDCAPGVVAYVDRGDAWEMLTNYLENAFTHGAPPYAIHVTESPDAVEIRVRDEGPGVPPESVPRLFRRFSRVPPAPGGPRGGSHTWRPGQQGGAGLGLWIVRNLARAGGGDAWYEPGEGPGSVFCLRLRRAPPGPEEP